MDTQEDTSIQDLPPETLTQIFLAVLPRPTEQDGGPRISRSHPAVVLSHVCHAWRELTLGTPQLWSGMHVETPRVKDSQKYSLEEWRTLDTQLHETTAAWVHRSGSHPLTVTIVLDIHEYSSPYEGIPRYSTDLGVAMRTVFRHSKRWQLLTVTVNLYPGAISQFLRACQALSPYDVLNLAIKILPRPSALISSSWSVGLISCPLFAGRSLWRVKLAGHWNVGQFLQRRVGLRDWAQLEDIGINEESQIESSHVLQLLQALPRHGNPPAKPITLLHLERLSLQGVPMGPGFPHSLVLPSLKVLTFCFYPHYHPLPNAIDSTDPPSSYGEGVLTLLQKCGPHLVAFLLNYDVLDSSSFPACLDSLNNDRLRVLIFITFCQPRLNAPLWHAANQHRDFMALEHLAKPPRFPNLERFVEVHDRTFRMPQSSKGHLLP
ncbi:hypothetical protein FA13DRAFT_1775513 [Coprinellus micaceus]|uniref:Uncharacterized protein n=1 Tax=Coprinellus micaceus TaxID=71717 RepID=A0A4Y7T6I1_COPMI|nr:hypothetical protein FA13DRAFT_1775513 [Coprinellus micaceus]